MKQRPAGAALVLAVLLTAPAVILPAGCGGEPATQPPSQGSGTVAPGRDKVELVKVVDGDTIWVRMPDGSKERVRYIGIDTPEIAHTDAPAEYMGEEASIRNAELLALGPLYLELDVDERDDFGRLLAYVWAGEVFVNERLVRDGYARAQDYPPNLARQSQLREAQREARAGGLGLWAPARTTTPTGS